MPGCDAASAAPARARTQGSAPEAITAQPVTVKPKSREAVRDTTDMGDIQTQVGESDVIDSLREATAAAVSGAQRESFTAEADTRETAPPPRRAQPEPVAIEDDTDDLLEELAQADASSAVRAGARGRRRSRSRNREPTRAGAGARTGA